MRQPSHDKTAELAEEIEAYLLAHPQAADTIEGIAKWWLAREKTLERRSVLENALELLEQRGTVVKTPLFNGRFIYSRMKH